MLDYSEYGGAPLLGVRGVSIICHGSSTHQRHQERHPGGRRRSVAHQLSQHIGGGIRPGRGGDGLADEAARSRPSPGSGSPCRRASSPTPSSRRRSTPPTSGSSSGPASASGTSPAPRTAVASLALAAARIAHGEGRGRARSTSTPSSSARRRRTGCCRPPPATSRRCSARSNAAAFDISAACPGFLYALTVAEGLIAAGAGRDRPGRRGREADRDHRPDRPLHRVLFGDGAGAAVLQRANGGDRGHPLDLHQVRRHAGRPAATGPAAGAAHPLSEKVLTRAQPLHQDGGPRGVQARGAGHGRRLRRRRSTRAGLTADQIDLLVPHQANMRIIEATAKHAGMPMEKVFVNVDRYGNTSSASIPLALDEAEQEGRLKPGTSCCWSPSAAGFTWGSGGRPVVTRACCARARARRRSGWARTWPSAFPAARDTFAAIDDALGVAAVAR